MAGTETGSVVPAAAGPVCGFALSCRLQGAAPDAVGQLLKALEEELETRGLVMGGGVDAQRLDVFILPRKGVAPSRTIASRWPTGSRDSLRASRSRWATGWKLTERPVGPQVRRLIRPRRRNAAEDGEIHR